MKPANELWYGNNLPDYGYFVLGVHAILNVYRLLQNKVAPCVLSEVARMGTTSATIFDEMSDSIEEKLG